MPGQTAQDDINDNFLEEQLTSTDIDFEKLVFRHIDRTLISLTMHPDMFPFNVEAAEALLWHYCDKKYTEEISKLQEKVNQLQKDVMNKKLFSKVPGSSPKRITDPLKLDGILTKNEFFYAIDKLKALMGVTKRAGFLPEDSIELRIGERLSRKDDAEQ